MTCYYTTSSIHWLDVGYVSHDHRVCRIRTSRYLTFVIIAISQWMLRSFRGGSVSMSTYMLSCPYVIAWWIAAFEINCFTCCCNLIAKSIEVLLIHYTLLCAERVFSFYYCCRPYSHAYENTLQGTRHTNSTTAAVQLSWWSETWARMVCGVCGQRVDGARIIGVIGTWYRRRYIGRLAIDCCVRVCLSLSASLPPLIAESS